MKPHNKITAVLFNLFARPRLQVFLCVSIALSSYAVVIFPFFMPSLFSLGYDNMGYNFPEYVYFENSLRHGFGFPRWYPYDGGLPAGIAAMNMISLTPHRIVGYVLTLFLPFKPVYTYKITILVGMAIIAVGWWLFLYQLTKSRLSATVGTCALLLGGSGLFVLHAEQAIATMVFIPYILLALLKTRENFKYILVLTILCGIALNMHYPFHALLTLIIIFIALILTGRLNYLFAEKIIQKNLFTVLLAGLVFILAITPSLYIVLKKNDFSSPVRQVGNLESDSYEDYLRLTAGGSSASTSQLIEYFRSSLMPKVRDFRPNDGAFTATMVHLILAGMGLFYFRFSLPVIIVFAFSIWATYGVSSTLPYYLFMMKFPFVNMFRQWIFFVFMVNFCISIFVAMGYLIVVDNLKKIGDKLSVTSKNTKAVIGVLTVFFIIAMVFGSKNNAKNYLKHFSAKKGKDPVEIVPRYTKLEFMDTIKWTTLYDKPKTLFQYKDWWRLNKDCPEITTPHAVSKPPFSNAGISSLISKPPFITSAIYNDINASSNPDTYLKPFCASNAYNHSVIARIPREIPSSIKVDVRGIPADLVFDRAISSENYYLHPGEFHIGPNGISLAIRTSKSSMVVLPYCYKLGLKIYVNNVRTESYPVYYGAMTGVFIPEGEVYLKAQMPFSFYELAMLLQAVLLMFVFAYIINNRSQEKRVKNIQVGLQ